MTLRFGSVNVVTYSRSGSTLLMGILNSIPGVLVRGENNLLALDFYRTYRRILDARAMPTNAQAFSPTHAWFCIHDIDLDEYLAGCSHIIRNALVPAERREQVSCSERREQVSCSERREQVSCYGFKEIRYPYVNDLEGFLVFLGSVMPRLGFVFNFRDHESVMRSGHMVHAERERSIEMMARLESVARTYVERNPDHAFLVRYEQVISGTPILRELFDFLGAHYDDNEVSSVLGRIHSTKTMS